MKEADLDILLKKLEEGEIGHIEEKNEYLKELEMAYMNTKRYFGPSEPTLYCVGGIVHIMVKMLSKGLQIQSSFSYLSR